MSADNRAFTNPPPGPSQPPHQPRWAWWVVGILIPLLGILVTILVSRPGSSDDKSDGNSGAPASTRSSAPAGSGATPDQSADQPAEKPSKSAPAAKPAFGPKVIEADTTNSGSYMEFDTSEPLVVANSTPKGADLIISASTGGAPDLFVPESHMTLAPLADSGAAPTADECAASVQRNGTYTLPATRGGGFCLTTTEGRTVYLKVITAPPAGLAKLEVTVWA
ncbi:hypothetical protein ACFOZ0_15270 [Streptomyces yaanensis]|uniref:Uncharacterized protein n=1 Tax=Streptomyces yaanensis TaxID=1142239 RepID=A0ABV7SCD3_9ACTN|nr:hypothetical protein [Streptomyces sp. CGMCC 4.7035]WNB98569.1 hypothetical protein Q2K21_11030 [Streptomyces sp. CGMCC 4.7035]